jgi:lysophospholipase L1-like esterase
MSKKSNILYFLELVLLVPCLPLLKSSAKKIRKSISKLPPQSKYLVLSAPENSVNMLVIGESTAAGVGASDPQNTFSAHIHRLYDGKRNIYTIGKNGLKASELQKLMDSKKGLPDNFREVVVLIGANDCFRVTAPAAFYSALRDFIDILVTKKNVERIILPIIPPVHQFPAIQGLMRFFLKTHRHLLTQQLIELGNINPKVDFENNLQTFTADFFAADGIHPSDEGYRMLAKITFDQLEEKKKRAA